MDTFAVLSLGSILVVFAIIAIAIHFDNAHEATRVQLPNKLAKKYFTVAAIRNDNNTYSVLTGYVTKKEFETITNYVRSFEKDMDFAYCKDVLSFSEIKTIKSYIRQSANGIKPDYTFDDVRKIYDKYLMKTEILNDTAV